MAEDETLPVDLTDEEWARIEPLLPTPSRWGRKPGVDLREVLNAIRRMPRSAGGWRMLPVHFGPRQTVYWWFRRFVRRLLFRTIHDVAPMLDREATGPRQRRARCRTRPTATTRAGSRRSCAPAGIGWCM